MRQRAPVAVPEVIRAALELPLMIPSLVAGSQELIFNFVEVQPHFPSE